MCQNVHQVDRRECQQYLRAASNTGLSARSLKTTLNVEPSLLICQRHLQHSEFMRYQKRKHTPNLTARHKAARLEYTKTNIMKPPIWNDIIWSNEKQFNLNGPEGCSIIGTTYGRSLLTYLFRVQVVVEASWCGVHFHQLVSANWRSSRAVKNRWHTFKPSVTTCFNIQINTTTTISFLCKMAQAFQRSGYSKQLFWRTTRKAFSTTLCCLQT